MLLNLGMNYNFYILVSNQNQHGDVSLLRLYTHNLKFLIHICIQQHIIAFSNQMKYNLIPKKSDTLPSNWGELGRSYSVPHENEKCDIYHHYLITK